MMNDTTMLVLGILGPIYLAIGLGFLANRKYYDDMYNKIKGEPFSLMVTGMTSLAIGLAIVRAHNLWTSPSEVLVSVIGWGALVKGVWISVCPKSMLKLSEKLVKGSIITFSGSLVVIIGAILTWLAYM